MLYRIKSKTRHKASKLSGILQASFNFTRKKASAIAQLCGRQRHTHIVICGSPRSGTSMFCNMLAATLKNFGFDYKDESGSKQTIRYKGDHVSKSPLDVLHLPDISRLNIYNKRIIALVLIRDPRDIITSVHENVPNEYFIGYDASYRVWGEHPDYHYEYDNIGLGEVEAAIARSVNIPQIETAILRYEDIVADTETVQNTLAKKFNLNFEGSFNDYHARGDRHVFRPELTKPLDESLVKWNRPVSTDWVCRWQSPQHHSRIIEQFTKFPQLFDMLIRYGYESDRKWFDDFKLKTNRNEVSSDAG